MTAIWLKQVITLLLTLHVRFNVLFYSTESVSVAIDGAREGLDILIDEISIIPAEKVSARDNPNGCIANGDFEVGDSRYCACKITCILIFHHLFLLITNDYFFTTMF